LENVTIFDYSKPNKNIVITAKKGNIAFSSDYQKIIVNLYNGQIHETSRPDNKQYRKIIFSRHVLPMDAQQFGFKRSNQTAFSRGDRELSSNAMRIVVDSLNKENAVMKSELINAITIQVGKLLSCKGIDSVIIASRPESFSSLNEYDRALDFARSFNSNIFSCFTKIEANNHRIDSYLVEIYKKYSIPVACLVFVLVGAPLGIMTKKGGFGIGASLSLGFFLLYWACLIGGEKLADRDITSPFLGMWIANIILTIFGIYLVYKVIKESIVINWDFLKKFTPKRYHSLEDRIED
jgi:lipopolysaccharide export system permease protein